MQEEFKEQDLKTIKQAVRESQKLSQNLKNLDFEISQFNNFTHRVKTLKMKSIFWGIFGGIFTGALLTILAVKPLVDMYGLEKSKNILAQKNINFYEDNQKIQIYTNSQKAKVYKSGAHSVLEIQK